MTDTGKYYIPKYLDEPFRLIIFTVDEFLVTFVPLVLVCVFVNEVIGIASGVIAYWAYIKYKRREASAYMKRIVYWMYGIGGGIGLKVKFMSSSANRKLKG